MADPVAVVLDAEALRAAIRDAMVTADPRGALVVVGDGWGPLTGPTLRAWVKAGRLRAFRGARQQLLAWEADVRARDDDQAATA